MRLIGLKKKLFPQKSKEKDDLASNGKGYIHRLKLKNIENYKRRAEIRSRNARIISGSPMPVFT